MSFIPLDFIGTTAVLKECVFVGTIKEKNGAIINRTQESKISLNHFSGCRYKTVVSPSLHSVQPCDVTCE